MTTLRERINAALDANGLQHWVIGTNPMRNHELAEACRDLLPLVLAEMEKLEEEAKYAPRLRVELRDTERELIAMTAEWNEARTLLAECRAQNRAMAETMSGLKSEREHIAAMTAERDAMRVALDELYLAGCYDGFLTRRFVDCEAPEKKRSQKRKP